MSEIKALTIKQPWAVCIVHGYKDVENRSWSTPYRGTLAIHAGKAQAPREQLDFFYNLQQRGVAPRQDGFLSQPPTGAIIGTVDLVDVVEGYDSPWSMDTRYQWVLANAVVFDEPIPATGKLGLWTWSR